MRIALVALGALVAASGASPAPAYDSARPHTVTAPTAAYPPDPCHKLHTRKARSRCRARRAPALLPASPRTPPAHPPASS